MTGREEVLGEKVTEEKKKKKKKRAETSRTVLPVNFSNIVACETALKHSVTGQDVHFRDN